MPKEYRCILILSYASFLVLGLVGTALGPSLPHLADRMNVALDAAGGLISSLSAGYLVAGLTAGPLVDVAGRRPVLLSALGLQAISLPAILLAPSLPMGLLAVFALGLGQGSTDITVHVVIGDATGPRRGTVLNRVHLFFGIGGLIGPALAGYGLESPGGLWLPFGAFAVLITLILLSVTVTPLPARRHNAPSEKSNVKSVIGGRFWLLTLFFVLYVGIEVGLGSWIFAFLREGLKTGISLASWVSSGFYLALTAGRLAGIRLAGRTLAEERLVLVGVGVACGGIVILWIGSALAAIPLFIAAVLLVGTAFGPIYPSAMSVVQERYPQSTGTAVGLVTVGASVGAIFIPWLLGWFLTHNGLLWSTGVAGAGLLMLWAVGSAAMVNKNLTGLREISNES